MEEKKKGTKKPSPFVVTWDMVLYVPLYALLLLAIFAGISALMIWGLEQVSFQEELFREGERLFPLTKENTPRVHA